MLFSVNYQSKYKADADEIRCPHNQLGTIFNFIKENPGKRYVIILPKDLDSKQFNKAIEQIELVKEACRGNYTIECENINQLKGLLAGDYNAFLRFPIVDWETFYDLVSIGASDIYIDGPLGFQATSLKVAKNNTKIRVSPTISPNAAIIGQKVTSFYIRPEDLELFDGAIDIIDFKESNQEKEDALFSIYKRGTFNYTIDTLIAGLPSVNNLMFKPDFAERRLSCAQKCKVPGYYCHHCENYFTIIQNLVKIVQKK